MPLTETDAGLPVALWATDREADFVPTDEGVKVPVTVWLWPAAIVAEVGETVNAASLEEIALTVSGDCPEFVIVNVCCPACPTRTFPKESVVGLMATEGGCAVPFPDRATDEGLPLALWAIERETDFAPVEIGANVTVTVCAVAPGLTVKEVGVTVNIVVSAVPIRAMDETVSAEVPVLPTVKVTCFVCPVCTSPKLSVVAERLMTA